MAASTVASVLERRAMLKALGPRPSPDEVEIAQNALDRINAQEADMMENLQNMAAPEGVNVAQWRVMKETEYRDSADRAKAPHNAVVQLNDMHEFYENALEEDERVMDGRDYPTESPSVAASDETNKEAADLLWDASENKRGTLDLSRLQLTHVPESLGRIESLICLDLSGNQLQVLPDSIAGLSNLETLNVNSNQLKVLPDSIGLLSKLKFLDVSTNLLRHLPESLGKCSALVEINANFNQLELLSRHFGSELQNLEKLDLHLNKLTVLPSSTCDLTALKHLDVRMNKLHGLPNYLGNMSALEYLDVSSNFNDLVSLPDSIGDLGRLTYCDLSFNQIRELPDSVGRLVQLKVLKLDGNPIEVPPMVVVEKSHEAVMEYMQERWKSSLQTDQVAVDPNAPPAGRDVNAWVSWAGNSVNSWVGGWLGSAPSTPGTQREKKIDILDQQL